MVSNTFERMLVCDIQRALDFTVGGFVASNPGDGRCKGKQRQREGQRSGAIIHCSSLSELRLLDRTGARVSAELNASLIGNKGGGGIFSVGRQSGSI